MTTSPTARLALAAAVTSTFLFSRAMCAQSDARPDSLSPHFTGPEHRPCVDSLPASIMKRVPLYISAQFHDKSSLPLGQQADLLADAVAQSIRSALGAPADSVPRGEPTLTWHAEGAHLHLWAYRDGHIAWRIPPEVHDTTGDGILIAALASLAPDWALLWPAKLTGDSAAFDLALDAPVLTPRGEVTFAGRYPGRRIPVATIAEPPMEPVTEVEMFKPPYPARSEARRIEATIVLQFVVDSTGHTDTSTIRDQWPEDRPRPRGEMAAAYAEFVSAARQGAAKGRFRPARIGGCAIPQLVQMPFVFRFP